MKHLGPGRPVPDHNVPGVHPQPGHGASGLFSTAQQLGGALGVALLGTVFFGYLGGHSFEAALVHTGPYAMGCIRAVRRGVDAAPAHGSVERGADRVLNPA